MVNRMQMQQVLDQQNASNNSNNSNSLQQMFQHTVDAQREANNATQRIVAQAFLDKSIHDRINSAISSNEQ